MLETPDGQASSYLLIDASANVYTLVLSDKIDNLDGKLLAVTGYYTQSMDTKPGVIEVTKIEVNN